MIFPIGDDQVEGGHQPVFSYTFLALNLAVFAFMHLQVEDIDLFYRTYGTIPATFLEGRGWATLISAMFIHGGFLHLAGNMVFLWVFADNIEATIGSRRFVVFYLLGGLVAGLAHIVFNTGSTLPAVGASGAISAVLGAYMVLFPTSRIKVFILFFFRAAYLPAFLFLGIWILQQMVSGIGAIGTVDLDTGGVAWWAHIGGFLFGFMAGFLFRIHRTQGLDTDA